MQQSLDITICLTGGPNPHNWLDFDPDLKVSNWSFPKFLRLLRELSSEKSKLTLVVHPLMEKKYFLSVFIAKIKGAKIIFFYESTNLTSKSSSLLITLIKKIYFSVADYVITVGNRSSEHTISFGISPLKVVELFNAVDSFQIIKNAASESVPNTVHTGHRYLFVGQFIPRKNVENLLHAFAINLKSNDSLTLAGSGYLQSHLEELVNELGLTDRVKFTGYIEQNQTYKMYYHHDTLILPSTEEVWGLVANEALTSGMHVVISDVCGVCDLITDFPGVFICGTDAVSINQAMQLSAKNWSGRIANPRILDFDTKNLAVKFIRQISLVNRK